MKQSAQQITSLQSHFYESSKQKTETNVFQGQMPWAATRLPEVPSELWNRSGNFFVYDITRFCCNMSVSQTEKRWIISRKEVLMRQKVSGATVIICT